MYGKTEVIATGSAKRQMARMSNCCVGSFAGARGFAMVVDPKSHTFYHHMLCLNPWNCSRQCRESERWYCTNVRGIKTASVDSVGHGQ